MLRSTSASDGRISHPSGLQALLSPKLKRLSPTPIPVSANPAQAKGSKCLGKPAGGRRVGPIMGSYVTAPIEIDTVPVKPSYTIVTFRKNVRPIKA